jgi:hypothetical protein
MTKLDRVEIHNFLCVQFGGFRIKNLILGLQNDDIIPSQPPSPRPYRDEMSPLSSLKATPVMSEDDENCQSESAGNKNLVSN